MKGGDPIPHDQNFVRYASPVWLIVEPGRRPSGLFMQKKPRPGQPPRDLSANWLEAFEAPMDNQLREIRKRVALGSTLKELGPRRNIPEVLLATYIESTTGPSWSIGTQTLEARLGPKTPG